MNVLGIFRNNTDISRRKMEITRKSVIHSYFTSVEKASVRKFQVNIKYTLISP